MIQKSGLVCALMKTKNRCIWYLKQNEIEHLGEHDLLMIQNLADIRALEDCMRDRAPQET